MAQKQLTDIQIDYWNVRGIDLYKQKNYRDADISYERALSLDPTDAKIWINMAASLFEQGMLDEALKAINKAIEIDQSREDSWNIKGLILLKKATKALENRIELDIDLKNVRVKKFAASYAQPIILLELNEKNYEISGVWRNKEEALVEQARIALDKALEIKTNKLAAKPTNSFGDWLDKGWLARIWSNMGLILIEQHNYEQAFNACDKAIGLDPKYSGSWYNKGYALEKIEKPHDAIGAYNKAIELDPQNAKHWLAKGNALMIIARKYPNEDSKAIYNEAIYAFEKAIGFEPFQINAWHQKGRALFEEGDYSEAIKALDELINIIPHDQIAWRNKCLCLSKLGRYVDAIKAANVTIALYERYSLCWFDRYNKLYELGKYDEALGAYDIGLDLIKENSSNYIIKGDAFCNLALWKPGIFKFALKAYDRATELDPLNCEAWLCRCIALNALGNINATKEAYMRAFRLALLMQHHEYIEND